MDGKLKNPALFVTLSRRAPVASFFRTTFAAGTTAPVASVTVAPNDPLENCANTGSCETAKAAISNPNNQKDLPGFLCRAITEIGIRSGLFI
jgi:hypothetical protein